jgi:hypothetical protein
MMKQQYTSFIVISFLMSFILLSVSIPPCDANYAIWGHMSEGSTYHNGTHICMPYADVHINITRGSTAVTVSLDSTFHIVTNTTQNATLAFVYPTAWGDDALLTDPLPTWGDGITNESFFMHIYGNGTMIDYTVIHYNSSIEGGFTEDFLNEFPPLYVDFAVFDLELTANTTLVLSTVSGSIFSTSMNRFDYNYIVGSARTFEGHTMERVQMHVVEEMPFLSKSFDPNDSLTIVENDIVTDAVWDLNVTEFSADRVAFGADVYTDVNWLPTVALSSLIVLIVLWFVYKKSAINKESAGRL